MSGQGRTFAAALVTLALAGCSSSGSSGSATGGASGTGAVGGKGGSGGSVGGSGGSVGGSGGSVGGGGGIPSYGPAEVLASAQLNPVRVVLRDGAVYWGSAGSTLVPGSGGAPGSLQKLVPGTQPITIAVGRIRAIALDADRIFWAEGNNGEIWSAGLDGTATTLVLSGTKLVNDLEVYAGNVYFSEYDPGGNAPTRVARVPVSGGSAQELMVSATPPLTFLELDAATLLVVESIAAGKVHAIDTQTGTPATTATNLKLPWQIESDSAHLYVATGGDGSVWRFAKAGGASEQFAKGMIDPYGLALDAGALYVSERATESGQCKAIAGSVHMLPLDGSAPTLLALGQACPAGIAVDATGVYWVNYGVESNPGSGSLMRAPRL